MEIGHLYGGSEKIQVHRSTNDFTFSSPSMIQELTPKAYDDNVLGNSNNYAYKIFKNAVGDVVYYYHTDHLMTPLAMTDSVQATVWQGVYYPFGKLYSEGGSAVNTLRFPGQLADAAVSNTSLYYNGFRWYGSKQGRYTKPDSLPNLSQLFAYSENSPIISIDPSGLASVQFDWQKKCPQIIRAISKIRHRVCDQCKPWWQDKCTKNPLPEVDFCDIIRSPILFIEYNPVTSVPVKGRFLQAFYGKEVIPYGYTDKPGGTSWVYATPCNAGTTLPLERTLMHEMTHWGGERPETSANEVSEPGTGTGCY